MLIDDVIKHYKAPPLEDMGDNNWRLWMALYKDQYFYSDAETHHLGLPAAIAGEIARPAVVEFQSALIGADDPLQSDYQRFVDKLQPVVEQCAAFGGVMLKPYLDGDHVFVDCVAPDRFVPLACDATGRIVRCVFIDQTAALDDEQRTVFYTRLEEHDFADGKSTIRNHAYVSNSRGNLGEPVPLSSVPAWQDVPEETTVDGLPHPLYAYLRYPQANNLDPTSPLGMSCFCRAIPLIQNADEQYSRILWEYTGTEVAIDADITVMKANGGLPKHGERLFRDLGLSQSDGFYKIFSPAIRDTSLFNGLNQILRRVEFNAGLSYGILSDAAEVAKTATEIKISKQRYYMTVANLQGAIEEALRTLAEIMALLAGVHTDFDMSFEFDDSILTDASEEQRIMLSEVAAGLLRPEAYLMRRYGVTEEQARDMMPEPVSVLPAYDGVE